MKNDLYPKAYNEWAGNPKGVAPNYEFCCEAVSNQGHWGQHQCGRKRGFGPDSAYCKQHDPEAVKARREESDRKYREQTNKRRYEWYGARFFNVLQQIADGHNNARGLAEETVEEFLKGMK